MGDVSLNDIFFYLGGVSYYFPLITGAMFRYGVLIYSLSLGMAISFSPLLSFTFLDDCIFLWRATWLRRYLACLMIRRIYSSSASWFRWTSRCFVASHFMSFRCLFDSRRYFDVCFMVLQCMCVGEWLKWVIRFSMLSIAVCLDCLFLMIESVIFHNWTSRIALTRVGDHGWFP